MADLMISLRPEYGDRILSGEKTVEVRRRFPTVPAGTRIWLYITKPRGAVEAVALVKGVDRGSPHDVWEQHREGLGVTMDEFSAYLEGADEAVALILNNVMALDQAISLAELRHIDNSFHPPQFYRRVEQTGGVAARLAMASPKKHKQAIVV